VTSHAGSDYDALPIQRADEITSLMDPDTTVVAIDEAQFFDQNVIGIAQCLADKGLRVIVAGLDTDFRGEPFGPMPTLMAQAEYVDKLHAICMVCGEPATRTQRIVNGKPAHYDDPVVIVGASEMYEARCRQHHQVPPRLIKQSVRRRRVMQDYHEFLDEILIDEITLQKGLQSWELRFPATMRARTYCWFVF
jgi:thymidine kinase